MCIIFFVFHTSSNVHAQPAVQTAGVPVIFQAKYSRNSAGAFEAAFNPFLIPYVNNFSGGIFTEKKFLLEHTNTIAAAACKSFNNGGVSLSVQQFGNTGYAERMAGLAYAKKISRLIAAIDFRYVAISISNSDKMSAFHIGVSGLLQVNDNVCVIMKIADPPLLRSNTRSLRSTVVFGGGWQITPSFYAGIETTRQELQPLLLSAALEYKHSEKICVGLSWVISTNQPCASLSWNIGSMKVKTGSVYHPMLGASPFAAFTIEKQNHIDE